MTITGQTIEQAKVTFFYSVNTIKETYSAAYDFMLSLIKVRQSPEAIQKSVHKSGEENTIPYKNDEEFVVVENPNPIELNTDFEFFMKVCDFNYLIRLCETEANILSKDLAILHYADRNNLTVRTILNLKKITIFKKVDGEATNKEIISKRLACLEKMIEALELKFLEKKIEKSQKIINEKSVSKEKKMRETPADIKTLQARQKHLTELEALRQDNESFVIVMKPRDRMINYLWL